MTGAKAKAIGVVLVVGLFVTLILGALAYHQVPEGHAGVEKNWGSVTGHIDQPGANWKVPIAESIQNVEVRPRTYTMSATEGEGDRSDADEITVKTVNGSTVGVDVTVRYRINADEADGFVREWNDETQMEQRLIRPTVRSDMRDEASDLQTSEIYTRAGREALAETARDSLAEEFAGQPITLERVQVRNIDLPSGIDRALDEKEVAKQRVRVEREKINQEQARAEQKRVQAQADADVIEIQGDALRENDIVLRQRYLDALDNGTVFVVPEGGETPMILDSGQATASG